MLQPRSLLKMLFIGLFAMLVVACKPLASFSVSPDPVKAGVEATFDASATVIYTKPKGNAAKSYAWDFGDGSTGEGKVATHTYAGAGTFKVKLTVVDTAGRTGVTTENLVVTAGDVVVDPVTTSLTVITQIAGGVSLSGAEVTLGTVMGTSNTDGLTTLTERLVGENQVITVKKSGYVTQSVRTTLTAGDETKQLLVVLMPEKETLSIANIAAAQTIQSNYLGASVTLPAGALVNASSGAAATGVATLKLTPWDIQGIDLQAMPGNGRALTSAGASVELISAGMMTVDFFDALGNKLQLASGKSATIQMDLPAGTTSIAGNLIAAGSTIPLWHFDEAQGLWIEEGQGTVVATATGLAVKATVSHFSTWNWDFYITEGGSSNSNVVNIKCVEAGNVGVPCTIVAEVTLPDGSRYYHHGGNSNTASAGAQGLRIVLLPLNADIVWTGTTADGRQGTAQSGPNGTVEIFLSPPTTSNFVRCRTTGNVDTACSVTLTATLANGSTSTLTRYIPAMGATVNSAIDASASLSWAASTGFVDSANNTWSNYTGAATSGTTGDVTIFLSADAVSTGKTILVSCNPNALDFDNQPVPLTSCSIQIRVYSTSVSVADINIPSGLSGPVAVTLPPMEDGAWVSIRATGESAVPVDGPLGGASERPYSGLVNNQQIAIQLYPQVPT